MYRKIQKLSAYLDSFQVPLQASGASFFIVMSTFPLAVLLLTLFSCLPLTSDDLLTAIVGFVPEPLVPLAEFILGDLTRTGTTAVLSVTAVLALWSASRGVLSILNGLNAILGSSETRSWLRRRLTAVFYTFLLVLAILLTLVLQVFGSRLLALLTGIRAGWAIALASLLRLRYWFSAGLLTLLFMLVFAVFPARRMRLRDVVPGAVFAAVGWIGFSALFSVYVNLGYGVRFYGSMATLILGMLWLYLCVCILFYGGIVCRLCAEEHFSLRYLRNFLKQP